MWGTNRFSFGVWERLQTGCGAKYSQNKPQELTMRLFFYFSCCRDPRFFQQHPTASCGGGFFGSSLVPNGKLVVATSSSRPRKKTKATSRHSRHTTNLLFKKSLSMSYISYNKQYTPH
ncbi:MAG: hypothetical protein ACQCN4_06915 [Candidatus Bathyarchaeia archaeon]